jgi:hypothetical protein
MISAFALSPVRAEILSPADREALLANLEKMREEANAKVEARFKAAIAAYGSAASSSEAAAELYLKCIEKLNFEDQGKKPAEFREWKKKESDKLNAPGHGLALRLQINWLILTLRAASPKVDREKLLPSVREIVDAIVNEAGTLKQHRQILDQAVTSSIFAKAYDLKGVAVESWPAAPGSIGQIYEEILLPPLRRADRLDALRAGWVRRIQQEMAIRQAWAEDDDSGKSKNGNGAAQQKTAYEKFVTETVPELQWQMEMDLFKNGDEQTAALRMLEHLQKHIAHKSARQWSDQLKNILHPAPASPAEAPAP